MRSTLLVVLALVCGCATVRPLTDSPANAKRLADSVDWKQTGDEATTLLTEYIRVDTTNPPGNEDRGAHFLEAFLAKEGIPSTLYEFAPGRSSLVARLGPTGPAKDKPLCLLSHLDVVTAEAAQWSQGTAPLSGVIGPDIIRDVDEGRTFAGLVDFNMGHGQVIWGRGALDMKGMGAIETMTLVLLKRLNVPLAREVILIAAGDEEVNSLGMKDLVEHHWKELDCGVMVNEGGVGLKDLFSKGQTVFPITVAEKGALWLELVADGEAGHGSTPLATRAPSRLAHALEVLATRQPTPVISDALYELLRRVGEASGGVQGFVLQHPALVDGFAMKKLIALPPVRAAITNTCQVTGFDGKGSAPNVIPSRVSAIVDCRVLPGTTPEQLLKELRFLLSGVDHVKLEVLHQSTATSSTWDDPFFDALERQLRRGRPDIVVGPALSPGFTDSNLARPMGVKAYGLVPFEIDGELLGTMHGKNERLPVAQLKHGLEVLFRAVLDVSAAP
jgi:acetylornithine deacetylase/succinyl-diaminopimelate desuccinylase-like protein